MNRHQRLAALVGVVALLWVVRSELQPGAPTSPVSKAKVAKAPPPRAGAVSGGTPAASDAQAIPVRTPLREAGNNPFNPPRPPAMAKARHVSPPPPPAVPAPVEAPAPPAPPKAPPLPYRFVGMVTEKDAPASVFLAIGERLLLARAGDTLEGGFRLQQISPRELSFLALPSNLTVRMAVPGEAP